MLASNAASYHPGFVLMSEKWIPEAPSLRDAMRAHRKPLHFMRKGRLLVALGLFATAESRAVLEPLEKRAVHTEQSVLSLISTDVLCETASSVSFMSESVIRRGDTLAALLQRLHVQESGLQAFLIQN